MRYVIIEQRWKDQPNPDDYPPEHPARCREVEAARRPAGALTVEEYRAELAKTADAAAVVSARIKAANAARELAEYRAQDPKVRLARMVQALAGGVSLSPMQIEDLKTLAE